MEITPIIKMHTGELVEQAERKPFRLRPALPDLDNANAGNI
jgi:hypothetical protein